AATVDATATGPAGTVTTVFSGQQGAGAQTIAWTPAADLTAGDYELALSATTTDGQTATASIPLVVDATLSSFAASRAAISPAAGRSVTVSFSFAAGPVQAELDVLEGDQVVATPVEATFDAGDQTATWDGTLADGMPATDGTYALRLTVTDSLTTLTRTLPLVVDSAPPVVAVVSAKAMRFTLSEPATVTLVVGTRRYTSARKAGPFHFWLKTKPYAYKVVAVDAAGNRVSKLYRTR
ncbi:MAG: hypothetical protein ACRDLK_05530, partial [Gaiellaceae bacterium]